MGIRETLNKYQKTAMVVSAVAVLAVVAIAIASQNDSLAVKPPKYQYFSDDDGKTFFEDDYSKVGPFERNGREAVCARVFRCKDGKLFVGYLERAADAKAKAFLEESQQAILASAAARPTAPDRD